MTFVLRKLLVLSVCWGGVALASVRARIDLETRVQEKFLNVVRAIDPKAQVFVNIRFRESPAELPGVGLNVSGLIDEKRIDWNDIESVDVVVNSSLDPFPPSLETMLRRQVLSGVRGLRVRLERTPPDLVALGGEKATKPTNEAAAELRQLFEGVTSRFDRLLELIVKGVPALVGTYLLFALVRLLMGGRQASRGAASLAQAIRDSRPSEDGLHSVGRGALPPPPKEFFAAPTGTTGADTNVVRELGAESLVALLSDCYWAELDGYARFLWGRMSFEQRGLVMRQWNLAMPYASYFAGVEAVDLGFHQHPYYVGPALRLDAVNNDDLAAWVRRDRSAWHALSPIRRAHSRLSLRERLECSAAPAKATTLQPSASAATSARRLFANLQIHKVDVEDERLILENPGRVVDHMMSIPSLTWLRLLGAEETREILARYSAPALAEVWTGPEEYLATLESLMPEKKVFRLREIVGKVPIRRDGEVMGEILREIQARGKNAKEGADENVEVPRAA